MGLAGRKTKQRITADPRNLSWADDASRFGSSYLAKLGWDSSKGLGVAGEGRTSHLKVSQKLDMLGIGAAQKRDPNGIAWKQNKEFESVLARLNAANEALEEKKPCDEDKKRKLEDEGDETKSKKRKKSKKSEGVEEVAVSEPVEEIKKPYVPRVKAHRARALASKNLASKSAAAIAEILGVAPSTSTLSTSTTAQTSGALTSLTDDNEPLEKLTTSTKSVADYFKERLAAKFGTSTPPSITNNDTESPRGGLGSSRLQVKINSEQTSLSESMFSSLQSSSFLAATMQISRPIVEDTAEPSINVDTTEKKTKKNQKEDESLSKAERKQAKAERKTERAKRKAEKAERKKLKAESL